ncbi:MAG TPA: hypothetical protein VKB46_17635 [Pyrinomonadaceae bacterium]|nr:hypothetical protein [Pyrinomonadaceae bacterium]
MPGGSREEARAQNRIAPGAVGKARRIESGVAGKQANFVAASAWFCALVASRELFD